jgi:hypothetical protein
MLRDLRPGATLFVLDKKERKIGHAVVTNNVPNMPFGAYMAHPQTVNISFRYDDRDIVLTDVNATIASADDARGSGLVICESNEALINELRSYIAYNDDMASKQSYFEECSKWGKTQLAEIDPAQKMKSEYESQLNTLMGKYDEMFNAMKRENDDLRARLESIPSVGGKKGKE